MTLAAAYIITVCGWSPGMIVEREIDGRQVSVIHWWEAPKENMKQWVHDGLQESIKSGELYNFEYPGDCMVT